MPKRLALGACATLAFLAPAFAEPPPGAASCSGCHATAGKASSAMPSLDGRDAGETLAAMIAYRDGTRPATVMNRIAKGFTDDELSAIAAWLAKQK